MTPNNSDLTREDVLMEFTSRLMRFVDGMPRREFLQLAEYHKILKFLGKTITEIPSTFRTSKILEWVEEGVVGAGEEEEEEEVEVEVEVEAEVEGRGVLEMPWAWINHLSLRLDTLYANLSGNTKEAMRLLFSPNIPLEWHSMASTYQEPSRIQTRKLSIRMLIQASQALSYRDILEMVLREFNFFGVRLIFNLKPEINKITGLGIIREGKRGGETSSLTMPFWPAAPSRHRQFSGPRNPDLYNFNAGLVPPQP